MKRRKWQVDVVVEAIGQSARTGLENDGIIAVLPVERLVEIFGIA